MLPTLEELMIEAGTELKATLPSSVGFTLLLFDYGDGGNMVFMSSARREDMISALEETLAHLKTGAVAPLGQPNHPANKRGSA
jgi:hypothetical protein